ncbi:Deoxyguanosinetriphosphate triphosphohydrolase [Slackia heliotrinireducens]|uniref:dGTP triphosphohydrolase n=1 Tax=Slackia heliotrinireducens (strain ATCC 29202 / DSM 20476 / NCTC 11029 / RHS 1) TaxID=471855 RepID=C7N408_SLAHD|nr:HD domain-containing protein [Slackia heliotrinireducens]ACV23744.1 dGTP triphosphohydrolase [Slackia heliotrinireducens DSM 20476]VEH03355.1 Deoxyguanosinetriphosphate triphosphohydrolase [Slackia heliotrinireducens]
MPYVNFSKDFQEQFEHDRAEGIVNPWRCPDEAVVRRNPKRDMSPRLHRPPFQRDIDKILNVAPYNRYAGKTQVFSFIRNDDISRRGLHVQLVARTARSIGRMLGLNDNLIEAIALGHDLGHTPFGHAGEHILNDLYHEATGRYFNHNVHSVRVLDRLYARNLSLQALDGIICHNGESSQKEFWRGEIHDFDAFDRMVEECYVNETTIGRLRPSTLEGCVVRISDMIAYVGKDRQDAINTGSISDDSIFSGGVLGVQNAQIINNLTVDIVEHSYMKDHIEMSEDAFRSLKTAKAENYERIYLADGQGDVYDEQIRPMFGELFAQIVRDIEANNQQSPVFQHFILPTERQRSFYEAEDPYRASDAPTIATDYLASMTDEYFLSAHRFMCPDSPHDVQFRDYFDGMPYAPVQ